LVDVDQQLRSGNTIPNRNYYSTSTMQLTNAVTPTTYSLTQLTVDVDHDTVIT